MSPITSEYHVNLVINKGYSSSTFIYEASERYEQAIDDGKDCYLLYLGDHDPSGEDMVRDIDNRLQAFHCNNVDIRKVALTMDQVREYNLPPNLAKKSDPRDSNYVKRHGDGSWELDALPPEILRQTVTDSILELINLNKYKKVIAREQADKATLQNMLGEVGQQ